MSPSQHRIEWSKNDRTNSSRGGITAFAIGLGSGYFFWGLNPPGLTRNIKPSTVLVMPTSYRLPVRLGDIGPRLIAAGAIDYEQFVQTYQQNGQPLTDEQRKMLTSTSDQAITIDSKNSYFLLNLFWAVGLTNRNPILTAGPIAQQGEDQIGNFASTGGWTLGKKTPVELLASKQLIILTAEQQASVETVAAAVYRPCCGNATLFPGCNHGMAMLGLLELMASQGASRKDMLEAAKYVNAFWFPTQAHELAVYFKANKQLDFAQIDAAELVDPDYSSGTGAKKVHEWLDQHNLLDHDQNNGGACSV